MDSIAKRGEFVNRIDRNVTKGNAMKGMMPVGDTPAQPGKGSRACRPWRRGTKGGGVSPPSFPQLRSGRMKDGADRGRPKNKKTKKIIKKLYF